MDVLLSSLLNHRADQVEHRVHNERIDHNEFRENQVLHERSDHSEILALIEMIEQTVLMEVFGMLAELHQ